MYSTIASHPTYENVKAQISSIFTPHFFLDALVISHETSIVENESTFSSWTSAVLYLCFF